MRIAHRPSHPEGFPAPHPLSIRARLTFLYLAAFLILCASSVRAAVLPDPTGDAGTGPDLTAFGAQHQDGALVLTLQLADAVSTPESGQADALYGFIDLDVDRNPLTGAHSFVDFLGGESGLGGEFAVDLSTWQDGAVDLMAEGATTGRVPITLAGETVTVTVPHDLLGTASAVHAAAVVGDTAAARDMAPDGGFLASTGADLGDAVLLQGDRFAVDISWRNFAGETGTGTLAVRSEETGVFWFFNDSNWELMVKVIDGCGANGHFWIFAAATTNVEYSLRLTDTQTGAVKVYSNPLGTSAAAITDNKAFATCP